MANSKAPAKTRKTKSIKDPNEEVLVIPRASLKELCGEFQGFRPAVGENALRELIGTAMPEYMLRSRAEHDPEYKQLIPYVLFRAGSPHGPLYYSYARTKKAGETRLHAKFSLGVGGHINPGDSRRGDPQAYHAFQHAMQREINEEVRIRSTIVSSSFLGLLNDETDTVGKVHLGVVFIYQLSQPQLENCDAAAKFAKFRTQQETVKLMPQMENWSRMAFEYILKAK